MMGDVYIYIFGEVIKKDEGKLWHNFQEEDLLKASTKKVGYSRVFLAIADMKRG